MSTPTQIDNFTQFLNQFDTDLFDSTYQLTVRNTYKSIILLHVNDISCMFVYFYLKLNLKI